MNKYYRELKKKLFALGMNKYSYKKYMKDRKKMDPLIGIFFDCIMIGMQTSIYCMSQLQKIQYNPEFQKGGIVRSNIHE